MDTPSRRFNDFYHDFGDDQDEKDDEYIDFDNIELNLNKEDEIKQVVNKDNQQQQQQQQQQIEEQHLSQKLSQLLTSTEQQQPPSADQIPTYLLSNNQTFEEIMNSLLQKSTNTIIQIKDLQQIAFLKHKLALIEIDISLWTTYLHSGTSQLRFENEQQQPEQEPQQQLLELLTVQPYLSIWPEALTKTMLQTGKFIKDELTYYVYLNYVEYTLQGLRNQQLDYHVQINQKKQQLNHYFTLEMEQAIDQFIQQQNDIILYRLQIESKILIVKYDYKDRLIELEFGRELPYQYQRNVFDNLTQTKLNKEIAKMEVALLKQRLANNYLPETLDSFQISPPESLNTITNQTMRQRIIDRQAKVVERTKSDMMMVYIMAAEAQFNENKMKFDTDTAQMKHYQRYGEADQKFTEKMLQIMQRRFKNIDERLKHLYDLKVRFFAKAPTVVKNQN